MLRYGIDIFSGAGGLSLGAEMAGIKIKTAIEINKSAAQTFLRNHKRAEVLQGDIQQLDPNTLHTEKKTVFVIMDGPPCQGFSMSNTRTRNMKNSYQEYTEVTEANFLKVMFERFLVLEVTLIRVLKILSLISPQDFLLSIMVLLLLPVQSSSLLIEQR